MANKFREYGVSAETAMLLDDRTFSISDCKEYVQKYGRYGDPEPIHVIEIAAVEQLKADLRMSDLNRQSLWVDSLKLVDEISALKSKLAKAKEALEFYADDFNWLYNQIKKSDCEEIKFNHVLKKPIPKGLEFEAGGKLARQALSEIGEG